MKAKPSECHAFTRQARAGAKRELNIHKASFIERRLFYLNHPNIIARRVLRPERSRILLCGVVEGQVQAKILLKIKLCYKGM
jgi:hypothetical protein